MRYVTPPTDTVLISVTQSPLWGATCVSLLHKQTLQLSSCWKRLFTLYWGNQKHYLLC